MSKFVRNVFLISLVWQYSFASLLCDFDHSECDFRFEEPWFITDRLYIPNVFNGPPAQLTKNSRFVAAQGRFGSESSGNLTGPRLDPSPHPRKLKFLFSKSTHATKLDIILASPYSTQCIDSVIGVGLLQWNQRTIVIPPLEHPSKLIFQVSGVENSFDVVALDDIFLESEKGELKGGGVQPYMFNLDRESDGSRVDFVRRAPIPSETSSPTCKALKCDFDEEPCLWILDSEWHIVDSRAVLEGGRAAKMDAPPVLLPINAHFQFDVFASETTQMAVLASSGAAEELLWSQSGRSLNGWNTVRIPIRHSSLPTRISLRAQAMSGGFVAISHTKAVDSGGRELFCGVGTPAIQPFFSESIQRLTAVQQLDDVPHVETIQNPLSQSTPSSSSMNLPQLSFPRQIGALPISPAVVNKHSTSLAVVPPQEVSENPNAQSWRPSVRLASEEPLHLSPPEEQQPAATSFQESSKAVVVAKPSRIESIQTTSPIITDLVQKLGGNSAMEDQLKMLAKRFGFDGLSNERAQNAISTAKQLLGNANDRSSPSLSALPAIQPVNVQKEKTKDHLLQVPPQTVLNAELVKKLASVFSLPQTRLDDARPFTRKNLDFIVQNAYNKFMAKEMGASR